MSAPRFNAELFDGAVLLKEWLRLPDGRQTIVLVGRVSILKDTELVGFESSRGESNWVARIEGATQSYNILGCQVRGAIAGTIQADSPDYYQVP